MVGGVMGGNLVLENKFLGDIEQSDSFKSVDQFFETEERLLKQLYRFEKKEAKKCCKKDD